MHCGRYKMTQNPRPTKYFQCRLIQIHALNSAQDLVAEETMTSTRSPSKRAAEETIFELPLKRPFEFETKKAGSSKTTEDDETNDANNTDISKNRADINMD